jgi:hypothetical protein
VRWVCCRRVSDGDAGRFATAQSDSDGFGLVAAGDNGWLVGVDGLGHGDVALSGAVAFAAVVAVWANRVAAAVRWLRVDSDDLSARVCCRDVRLSGRVGRAVAGVWWAGYISRLCCRHRHRNSLRDRGCRITWDAGTWIARWVPRRR